MVSISSSFEVGKKKGQGQLFYSLSLPFPLRLVLLSCHSYRQSLYSLNVCTFLIPVDHSILTTMTTSPLISNPRPRPCPLFICIGPRSNRCTISVYFHSFVSEHAPHLPLGQIGLDNLLLICRSTFSLDFFCVRIITSIHISVYFGDTRVICWFGLLSFSF